MYKIPEGEYRKNLKKFTEILELGELLEKQVKNLSLGQKMRCEIAATFLTFGLNPEKTIFYKQSDISEIFELTSILMNYTPKGLMNRAHAYKAILEKDGNDDNVNMGLYTYPILMAADILAMNSDIVPVGLDQKQHIEIARDIANSFNVLYKNFICVTHNFFL